MSPTDTKPTDMIYGDHDTRHGAYGPPPIPAQADNLLVTQRVPDTALLERVSARVNQPARAVALKMGLSHRLSRAEKAMLTKRLYVLLRTLARRWR
jgi:hypothetical protein